MDTYNQNPNQSYDKNQSHASPAQPATSAQPVFTPLVALPPVPNATASLVLGILSLVFLCCYGFPGLILGIIGLVLANNAISLYNTSPQGTYSQASLSNANAGRICSIISIVLAGMMVVSLIIYFIAVGSLDFFILREIFDFIENTH